MKISRSALIFILGCMTALSPFSIDMYLPAFQTIAQDFNSTVAEISLSLSSYFIGLSFGQLFYGPLLDRYGRKKPLYVGLGIYILASILCLVSTSASGLIAFRFIQAIGGCAAGVASMAMVRDLFTVKESAKVYSLLILILGTSPLLAPTIGGYLTTWFGWHSVFIALALMSIGLLAAIKFLLPETHQPDPTVTLRPGPIFKTFSQIIKNPQFYTYVFAGATAFSGLFVYLAGSTVIFLNQYKVSPQVYGWIFASIAAGMIISSQFNSWLLKKYSNEDLVKTLMMIQVGISLSFVILTYFEVLGLISTVAMFFLFMSTFGIVNPNSGALALAPFAKTAGSAAALMGFIQMGVGAVASASIGVLGITDKLTIISIMATASSLGLCVLLVGRTHIHRQKKAGPLALETVL